MLNKRSLLVALIATCAWSFAVGSSAVSRAPLPDGATLSITKRTHHGYTFSAYLKNGLPAHTLQIDRALQVETQNTDVLHILGKHAIVQNSKTFIILVARTPSTSQQGLGYCGSGMEDRLLLTEWLPHRRQLRLRDTLLVQSCLQTLSLWSDTGGDAFAALMSNANPARMQWSWVRHPTYGNLPITVFIDHARFVIQPAQTIPDSEEIR